MPSRKLIERLNKEADESVRAIREKAEGEAEGIREEARRKIEALSRRYRALEEEAMREKTSRIRAAAEGEARRVRQGTDQALASRLREIAFSALSGLRGKGYEGVLRALAAEVPTAHAWRTVRVNPADVDLASEAFPGAEVQGDDSIAGGLEAVSKGGRVRIVNTFEKRLERAWDQILPGLLAKVHEEHASD